MARVQPPWKQPQLQSDSQNSDLKIYNSLTRQKDVFAPISKDEVTWYSCGPTVYDDAHLGHARNYVTIDILRRILRDYFKYRVRFVQNVTDVDDKIILRARQRHLLNAYKARRLQGSPEEDDVLAKSLQAYIKKNLPKVPQSEGPSKELSTFYPNESDPKTLMHLRTARKAAEALERQKDPNLPVVSEMHPDLEDIVRPYLDAHQSADFDAKDHTIFTSLTKEYEDRFTEDMRSLNVLDPDETTRVTEYVPRIVDFVKKIEANDFAYRTSDGSVYFEIASFEAAQNHYARLRPENRNGTSLQAEGEGDLTRSTSEKRSNADFVLWKSSKQGEPSWPSPWGDGRPGWHIECSAMASDRLGKQIDIHTGGVDLAFPHHDNELAQSEAYWLEKGKEHDHQWVNYFLHMGHLSISGAKMSKSLKNFTTIREALEKETWTSRSLRIVLLLGHWRDGIEITDDLVKAGSAWEDKVDNFFIGVLDLQYRAEGSTQDVVEIDRTLREALQKAQDDTTAALSNSFDTATTMAAISSLITTYNSFTNPPFTSTVRETAQWITSMVNMFGLNGTSPYPAQSIGWSGVSIPPDSQPIIYEISSIRDTLRDLVIKDPSSAPSSLSSLITKIKDSNPSLPSSPSPSSQPTSIAEARIHFLSSITTLNPSSPTLKPDVLTLCDTLRDTTLWSLGLYLEDRTPPLPSLPRPITRTLRLARQEREARASVEASIKAEREKKKVEEQRLADEKARVDPMEMFKVGERAEEFSEWDERGLPVKMRDGGEVPKSRSKKLVKEWDLQRKRFEALKLREGGGEGRGKAE